AGSTTSCAALRTVSGNSLHVVVPTVITGSGPPGGLPGLFNVVVTGEIDAAVPFEVTVSDSAVAGTRRLGVLTARRQ
ncbi:MAG: hypothetical protein ACE5PT_05775, partial [Gemmatimonadales bacterium]